MSQVTVYTSQTLETTLKTTEEVTMIEKADRWEVGDGYGTYVNNQDGGWVDSDDYEKTVRYL